MSPQTTEPAVETNVPVGTVVNFRKSAIGSIVTLPDGREMTILACPSCGDGAIGHVKPSGAIVLCHELTYLSTPEE
jgi:hypothetical protein